MDLPQLNSSSQVDQDEWDTDGYVIPSIGIEDSEKTEPRPAELESAKPSSLEAKKKENIYLGPHGAPPSLSKQQELNPTGRKQKFKQKLKEADKRAVGTGRENKLENLRELVGSEKSSVNMSKDSARGWLDPHCHESQFDKWSSQ